MNPLPSPGGSPLPSGVRPLTEGEPRHVGPFRVVGRLGSGGMGVVYAALDDRDRRVAVKCVHRVYATDEEFRARFAREVALVRRVRAACVPRFLSADARAEVPWLATEYVPGPTLSEYVRTRGVLEGASLIAFAVGVAEALTAIHGVGVVHRDLKPGNVILSPEGPRVLDFGIARAVEETALTRTGGLVGTPRWVSPEQYGGEPASDRSDVFAWAGLVCFAATGHGPFDADGIDATIARILSEPPRLAGLPDALRPLLERALTKDPARRPGAAELLAETAGLLPEEATTAVPPGGRVDVGTAMGEVWTVPTPSEEMSRWLAHAPRRRPRVLRRRPLLALGAVMTVLVVLAGGVGLWTFREGSGDSGQEVGVDTRADDRAAGGTPAEDMDPGESDPLREVPEDVPEEYRELYETGTVVVEPVEDDAMVMVRKLVSEDGREELEEMRIHFQGGINYLDTQVVHLFLEYLLDFGEVHVRPSDFAWAERIGPEQERLDLLRAEAVQSNLAMYPDNRERSMNIDFPVAGDGVVYYLPEDMLREGEAPAPDHPGGVCHLGEEGDRQFPEDENELFETILFPHDVTSSDGVPRNSCVYDGS